MATFIPAKISTQFIFYASLVSQANTKIMQVNPTIAAGDFKVSIDGGALANLGTLPTVTPAGGVMVKFTLSTSEMAGANATVVCSDAAGSEWCDLVVNIPTAARQIDDLAYPATSGRSMVVDASGLVDANAVKVGPTGSGTAQTAGDIIGDTNDIQTRLPAALTAGGNIKADALAWNALATVALPLIPTVAGRTLDVASTGEAGLDLANINTYAAGPYAPTGIIDSGTAQSATGTTLQLRAAAAFADSELIGATIVIRSATAGAGQSRLITAYTSATDTATVDTWTTTPTGTIVYDIFGTAKGSASLAPVDVTKWNGTAVSVPTVAGVPNVNAKTWNDLATVALPLVPTTAGRTLDVSATGEAGLDWANIGSPTTAQNLSATNIDVDQIVASVSGAVASVTGAVGSVTAGVSVATGGIAAASFAASAIDSAALAASAVDEILDDTIGDGTLTVRQALRIAVAALGAKLSGAETTTVTIRNVADSADVIVATVDADGNRTATTVTP